jgi:hypothetical protein
MDELNENDVERRLAASPDAGVRVVLAEADAPGALHYLLEAEGFHVVGCASDERELGRVLGQDLDPDVIVLDADIAATSVLVARELAPEAHVIAIWPDGVLPPAGGEQVSPRLVSEDLGPMIRRHLDKRVVPVPDIVVPSVELAAIATGTGGSGAALGRAASRLSVTSVAAHRHLVDDGRVVRARPVPLRPDGRPREDRSSGTSFPEGGETSDRRPAECPGSTARAPDRRLSWGSTRRSDRAPRRHRGQIAQWRGTGGGDNTVGDPAPRVDRGGDQGTLATGRISGSQGGGQGRPRRGSGRPRQRGQGDQGGGQGDQGGGQGDRGGSRRPSDQGPQTTRDPDDQGGGSRPGRPRPVRATRAHRPGDPRFPGRQPGRQGNWHRRPRRFLASGQVVVAS